MTAEEAIKIIQNEVACVSRDCNIERPCSNCDLALPDKGPILEAYNIAVQAIEELEQIKGIINTNLYIQEDVIRYKMICEVINSEN